MRALECSLWCADAFPATTGESVRPTDQRASWFDGLARPRSAARSQRRAVRRERIFGVARRHARTRATNQRDEISHVRRLFIRGEFEVSRMMWPNAARGGDFCL